MSDMSNDNWQRELDALMGQIEKKAADDPLGLFRPYAFQAKFLDASAKYRIVSLWAGNKVGKTYAACAMLAAHLTGNYWPGYKGHKFKKAINAWACSNTLEAGRDTVQAMLFGQDPRRPGGGFIPASAIVGKASMSHGVPNAIDFIDVRHKSGGVSRLWFKPFSKGREPLQGPAIDFALCDEQPGDLDTFMEIVTRGNSRRGITLVTATPLLGRNSVYEFLEQPSRDRVCFTAGVDEAEHFSKEDLEYLESLYPAHMRGARLYGTPMVGEGLVFDFAPTAYTVPPFEIPGHFLRIAGIDFGVGHKQATIWLAIDPETGVSYAYDEYCARDSSAEAHAIAIKRKDPNGRIKVSWPRDGLQRSKADAEELRAVYRKLGVNMLGEFATSANGGVGLETTVIDLYDALKFGQLKIVSTCNELLAEMRSYSWKDEKIQQVNDDCISALRYAYMMRRRATQFGDSSAPEGRRLEGWAWAQIYNKGEDRRGRDGPGMGVDNDVTLADLYPEF